MIQDIQRSLPDLLMFNALEPLLIILVFHVLYSSAYKGRVNIVHVDCANKCGADGNKAMP